MELLKTAIGGALGIGGALISNQGQKNADARQNQANLENQQRADATNFNFWKLQNRYNSPKQQMARLREAGLNPHLVYGNGTASTGNAGTINASKAASSQNSNRLADINTWANTAPTFLQTDNLEAQNTVLLQEAALKAAQTADTAIKTSRSKFDLGLAEELRQNSLSAAQMNLLNMEEEYYNKQAQGEGLRADASLKWQSIQPQLKKLEAEVRVAQLTATGKEYENKLREIEARLAEYGITNLTVGVGKFLGTALQKAGMKAASKKALQEAAKKSKYIYPYKR